MRKKRTKRVRLIDSLGFKIGTLIVLVEMTIFFTTGVYYINYFSQELASRTEAQIKTPGVLINRGVLTYNAIENEKVIEDIVGGSLEEGMIIGLNHRVFFSFKKEHTGSLLKDINPSNSLSNMFDFSIKEPKVFRQETEEGEYLHCFSPLFAVDGKTPRFFVYLKLDTSRIKNQINELTILFSISSLICILITSLVIFLFFHRFVFIKLIHLATASAEIKQGQLEIDIPQNILKPKDEISVLAKSFMKMTDDLQKTTTSIDNLNREIQQRKQVEAKHCSLLENLPDHIINVDRWYKMQYLNLPIQHLGVDELIGTNLFDLIVPSDRDKTRYAIAQVFEIGSCDMMVIQNQLPNGKSYWLEIRFAAIQIGDTIDEVMLIATDVTKRKLAEEKLKITQKELIEKAHRAGMFDIAANSLHNVGNLLNSVVASIHIISEITRNSHLDGLKKANRILRENLDDFENFILNDPKSKKLLQYYLELEKEFDVEVGDINFQIERLVEKVESITQVIKSQEEYVGFGSISDEHILDEIVKEVVNLFSVALQDNKIKVIQDLPDLPKVQVQKSKVVQILKNLISNAIESMKDASQENRILRLTAEIENSHVVLRVSDTGIGIEPQDIKKIFSFGVTTKEGRQGIGLHSSANYMTEMKGRMWAESEGKNKGTTFFLQFTQS